jgi:hypothetical protein
VTRRDRYIVVVVGLVAILGAYWFMALTPKRDKLGKLDKDLTSAQQSLTQSQQEKVSFAQAQVKFPRLYASLGRLGKAVPVGEDVPSLLVQLNHSAAQANVDFQSIELKLDLQNKLASGADASAGATAPAAGATGASGATGATPSASSTTTAGTTTTAASGSLQPLPFEYKFSGDFVHLERLIHNVTELVASRNRQISISGRLIVIQGFSLKRSDVTIVATTYMLPADQGLFGGATATGPAGADQATPQPAAASATATTPPSAAVTP